MAELFTVFLNVIMPVFGIVAIGYLLGGRLEVQAQSLTRVAYYVFVPAFFFQALSSSNLALDSALKMPILIVLAHVLAALVAGGIGRLFGRSREMIAAFVMIASFGNVGNYGLAVITFQLGEEALPPATIYAVAITLAAFIVCVGAAGWARGGGKGALWGLLKTPVLWATPPALLVSAGGLVVPLTLSRMIGLLAGAMIPVMLFSLGLQLREQKRVTLSTDVWLATAIRLLLVPVITLLVLMPFDLGPIEHAAGVLQAAMPTAILVAIISKENDIVPGFVTSVVVVSTLASLITLTLLMVLL